MNDRERAALMARRVELLELIRKGAGADKRGELAQINDRLEPASSSAPAGLIPRL